MAFVRCFAAELVLNATPLRKDLIDFQIQSEWYVLISVRRMI